MTVLFWSSVGVTLFLGIFTCLKMHAEKESPMDKVLEMDAVSKVTIKRKARRSTHGLFGKKQLMLERAGIYVSYIGLLSLHLVLTVLLLLIIGFAFNDFLLLALVMVLSYVLPKIIIKQKTKSNIAAFEAQLNDGIVLITNALKAGYSFLKALSVAAEDSSEPLALHFKTLLKQIGLGVPLDQALHYMTERMPSQDLDLVVNALLIQQDAGGNLSEILENISETIVERQKIKNELKTLTAQGRLSGMIVMAMPFALGAAIYLFNPDYMRVLFETLLGRIMLAIALVGQTIGWLLIKKIISVDW